ncbi:MAG: beta-carotene ketolase [Oscillatoriales cyanobacterium SM2_2_1]|nr:beta-carotene ketolase [Oscillatoriales cyanobacterium SM2_2_1]
MSSCTDLSPMAWQNGRSRRNTLMIMGAWLLSLMLCLALPLTAVPWYGVVGLVMLRSFCHTGMFIIAHDAAHGTLWVGDRQRNDRWGQVAIFLYALLPFDRFVWNHGLHHDRAGRVGDPDYHDGRNSHPLRWYGKFMTGYLDDPLRFQIFIWFTVFFHLVRFVFDVQITNLLLFWVLPILLSSLQLFFFGTYLPHREPAQGYTNPHHAYSNGFPEWLSLLTCYHFGYHYEHHEFPHLPWFMLPKPRWQRDSKAAPQSQTDQIKSAGLQEPY